MVIAIIPARGGSKGIPRKNLIDLCGRPLIAWSIDQALKAHSIDEVYVTSDDDEILNVSREWGAQCIKRPESISGDTATSESAWLHAVATIEEKGQPIEFVVCMQATSPARHAWDLDRALELMRAENMDSLFSGANIGDFLIWKKSGASNYESLNYDYKNRKRRQDFGQQVLENGSFYICRPEILKNAGNRLGGKIGFYEMPLWKSFEIDEIENVRFLSMIMENYILKSEVNHG